MLVDFATDDSSDVSMTAAYWISQFSKELLYGIENRLLELQNNGDLELLTYTTIKKLYRTKIKIR